MKINFLKTSIVSALVLSLGLGISSCKKEDDLEIELANTEFQADQDPSETQ